MAEKLIRQFWGGFVDGKLDLMHVDTGFGGFGTDGYRKVPALFLSRAQAKEQYQDVRRVNANLMASPR